MSEHERHVHARVNECLLNAARATREQDLDGLVEWLTQAVVTYEQHPSAVHAHEGQLTTLLTSVRAALSLCRTLRRNVWAMEDLERRAEALRIPLQ